MIPAAASRKTENFRVVTAAARCLTVEVKIQIVWRINIAQMSLHLLNLSEKIDIILNEEKADPGIRMSKGILNR